MERLLFEPPVSTVSTTFWRKLGQLKLEEWRLDSAPIPLTGHFEPGKLDTPLRLFLDEESFETTEELTSYEQLKPRYPVQGTLYIYNTMPEFKAIDKQAILAQQAKKLLEAKSLTDGCRFLLFVHVDLKKHRYYYHFCFPSLCFESIEACPVETAEVSLVDGSGQRGLVAGWWLRNWLHILGEDCRIALKSNSFTKNLRIKRGAPTGQATGWERNERDQIAPRQIDLSAMLDPTVLIAEAANLNLKLIKWRLMPDLNLQIYAQTRCLLLGAGTLGCNVARGLLGWGFKHLTMVDNGQVSHSNPLRQSLFTQADVGFDKAERAAARLLEIDPTAHIIGRSLHIPMPGHRLDAQGLWKQQVKELEALISAHDVIFLLTDSRESRWLPTMLARGKLVMTVALGFDSSVVMRHGCSANGLACYFCADQLGPSDSLSNRTLDQQCTVSRPGISMIASGLAVEMVASLLQHPLKEAAPPTQATSPTDALPPQASMLGVIPHQQRTFLGHGGLLLTLTGQASTGCVACSDRIQEAWQAMGLQWLEQVLTDPSLLVEPTVPINELDVEEFSDFE